MRSIVARAWLIAFLDLLARAIEDFARALDLGGDAIRIRQTAHDGDRTVGVAARFQREIECDPQAPCIIGRARDRVSKADERLSEPVHGVGHGVRVSELVRAEPFHSLQYANLDLRRIDLT